jgi:hypothetical protein
VGGEALPEFPVEGGCQCGAVRYRLKASPLTVYNCHCKDCQRFSGAAWSMSMIVRDKDFEVLSGQTVRYDRKADSGNVIAMNFCAHCHGWLWNRPAPWFCEPHAAGRSGTACLTSSPSRRPKTLTPLAFGRRAASQ